MVGGVYSIRIQGHTDNEPHPHVVILEFDKECLVVPAFGSDGHDLEERLSLLESMGVPRDVASVELDNSVHVKWVPGRSGKPARWCAWRNFAIPKREITAALYVGEMDEQGLLEVFRCIVRYADVRPHEFARKRIKRLKETLEFYEATRSDDTGPPS